MVRIKWERTAVAFLASAGMALGQQVAPVVPTPAAAPERVMTVQEKGQPAQTCRVVQSEKQSDGSVILHVQNVATGETMTLLESKGQLAVLSKMFAKPAQPTTGDWRQSWGKAQGHHSTAEVKAVDPLKNPDRYSRRGLLAGWGKGGNDKATVVKTEEIPIASNKVGQPAMPPTTVTLSSSSTPAGTTAPVIVHETVEEMPAKPARKGFGLFSRKKTAKVEQTSPVIHEGPIETEMMPTMGMRSVMAAGYNPQAIVTPPTQVAMTPEKTRLPVPPVAPDPFGRNAYAQQPNPYMKPAVFPLPGSQLVENAFTKVEEPKPPSPQLIAAMEAAGNAFSDAPELGPTYQPAPAAYAARPQTMPAATAAMVQQAVASAPTASTMNTPMLVSTLQNALLPSEREKSADALAKGDDRGSPQVVQAVLTGAKTDPAATVRAACARNLSCVCAPSENLISTLQQMRFDGDPRVIQEVDQALRRMGR